MMFRRRPLAYFPPPAEVLDPAELARAVRFKAVYAVAATFELDCLADAARVLDRLQFEKWRHDREIEARP